MCVCAPDEKTISYNLTHIFVKERYVGKRISDGTLLNKSWYEYLALNLKHFD